MIWVLGWLGCGLVPWVVMVLIQGKILRCDILDLFLMMILGPFVIVIGIVGVTFAAIVDWLSAEEVLIQWKKKKDGR